MSSQKEIMKYLQEKVDPFLRHLLLDLMKSKPEEVYSFLNEWIRTRGQEIKDSQDAQNQVHQSVHYEEFKQSVIDVQPPQIDEAPVAQEEAPVAQDETPAPQEAPVEPAPQEEAPAE